MQVEKEMLTIVKIAITDQSRTRASAFICWIASEIHVPDMAGGSLCLSVR